MRCCVATCSFAKGAGDGGGVFRQRSVRRGPLGLSREECSTTPRVADAKPAQKQGPRRVSLLAPLFLAGLLAVGLPWWLHRLSSDNPNKQRFSSLMFLEPGEPRRVLAKKVQYLLLLALRIGVLALLALAFAEPALRRSPQAGEQNGARLHSRAS